MQLLYAEVFNLNLYIPSCYFRLQRARRRRIKGAEMPLPIAWKVNARGDNTWIRNLTTGSRTNGLQVRAAAPTV